MMERITERADSPVSDTLSAEYYYMKALSYLQASADSSSEDGQCSCLHCPSSEDKMEDDHDFATAFRPGLTLDDHQACGSSGGTTSTSQYSTSPLASSELPPGGTGSQASLKSGRSDCRCKTRVKRKWSDGHVHWADEFQKDLTRCHPRKSYSRHPSLNAPLIKPILKSSAEDCDQS